jgi:hypothetical protein
MWECAVVGVWPDPAFELGGNLI